MSASTLNPMPALVDLATRTVLAADPRPGDGWGWISALRTPLLVLGAVVLHALPVFGLASPEPLTGALTVAAVAVLAHDTGAMKGKA